ncbi:hypothetical protein D3C72_1085190 [compost metagenome]
MLAFNGFGEAVVFRLQPVGGTLRGFKHLRLRARRAFGVFKLRGKGLRFQLRFLKRVTGDGKLCAGFPESLDARRLRVKFAQAFL